MANQIVLRKEGSILLAFFAGEIDHSNAGNYKCQIISELYSQNFSSLILDFTRVSFIDSSGIGLILGRYNEMRLNNGILVISGASPQLLKLLSISGINTIIKNYDTSAKAMKEVSKYESYRTKV